MLGKRQNRGEQQRGNGEQAGFHERHSDGTGSRSLQQTRWRRAMSVGGNCGRGSDERRLPGPGDRRDLQLHVPVDVLREQILLNPSR